MYAIRSYYEVLVNAVGKDDRELTVALFTARRKAEIALSADPDFYICTLSQKVVGYKGLMT